MSIKLDEKDIAILALIQENSKLTANQIAKKINTPITTVFAKTRFAFDNRNLLFFFFLMMMLYFVLSNHMCYSENNEALITQRDLAKEIARFPEVQEVHIITGDWDLIVKVRAQNVEAIGKFVVDKLRLVRGLDKTLTCMVFETVKESTSLPQVIKNQKSQIQAEVVKQRQC